MIRNAFVAAVVVLGCAATSQAGVLITRSDAPTVGLAGYTTVTLTATTDNGSQIHGFDFASQPSYGFFGPMNQVNPAGVATVFDDFNFFFCFVCGQLTQDSQFKFNSSSVTVPAGFASESNTKLRAIFASGVSLGTSVPFVQLVIPEAASATVNYVGQIQTILGSGLPLDNNVSGSIPVPIPEPASAALVGLVVAIIGGCCRRRRPCRDNSTSMAARSLTPAVAMLCVASAILTFTPAAHAAVIITSSGAPTVGLPNYTTYTLTATTDIGQIQGFDFASQPAYGLFGSMNQVNPAGIATIFTDANAFFPFVSADVSQDSQFKFASSAVTVPAGFASESATSLRAVFAASAPLGASVPFAQLAIPNSSGNFNYVGQIQTVLGGIVTDVNVAGTNCLGCIPPQIVDATINNLDANNPGVVNHTVQLVTPVSASLSNFAFDSFVPSPGGFGTGPATPATFNTSTRKFNWNTVGSPLGTYKWTLTATNNFGFDNGSITVNVTVPEPASVGLLCVALFSLASCVPKRGRVNG